MQEAGWRNGRLNWGRLSIVGVLKLINLHYNTCVQQAEYAGKAVAEMVIYYYYFCGAAEGPYRMGTPHTGWWTTVPVLHGVRTTLVSDVRRRRDSETALLNTSTTTATTIMTINQYEINDRPHQGEYKTLIHVNKMEYLIQQLCRDHGLLSLGIKMRKYFVFSAISFIQKYYNDMTYYNIW